MKYTFVNVRFTEKLKAVEEPMTTSESGALAPSNVVHADDQVPMNQPADYFPKFPELPPELRLDIWDLALREENFSFRAPLPPGSIQRFRFDLRRESARVRVKPGLDESRSGWVACFTPLRINKQPYYKFLRVCFETRHYMMRRLGMSMLTVYELEYDANNQPVGRPRRCHMPYNFERDVFCVEGISHGVELALGHTVGADGKPHRLAEYLDRAVGLRFAPRIKRLAIIPHHDDIICSVGESAPFSETRQGHDTVSLAKRFPALVTLRSAIPQVAWTPALRRRAPRPRPPTGGHFVWFSASLRGRGLGGPTRMSEADRDELFRKACQRIFHRPFHVHWALAAPALFDDWRCLARRSKYNFCLVDDM